MSITGNIGGGSRPKKRDSALPRGERSPMRPLSAWGLWLLENPVAGDEEPGEGTEVTPAVIPARRPYRAQVIEKG